MTTGHRPVVIVDLGEPLCASSRVHSPGRCWETTLQWKTTAYHGNVMGHAVLKAHDIMAPRTEWGDCPYLCNMLFLPTSALQATSPAPSFDLNVDTDLQARRIITMAI
ncbi:hypothetical protein KP509_21G024700 [Ceratopteris richardii]|uniref:Uncharacterized protein n=1 Tax=Ceratopteris richardii TaxID=49495 RepID=A0A8T2SBH3_CERRI|nr:hypothetical protein KP509_21G024700 [Ceratopteris richardii]